MLLGCPGSASVRGLADAVTVTVKVINAFRLARSTLGSGWL